MLKWHWPARKAYDIQERWIQAMEEIGAVSTPEQIQLAHKTALQLFDGGSYSRLLSVIHHYADCNWNWLNSCRGL